MTTRGFVLLSSLVAARSLAAALFLAPALCAAAGDTVRVNGSTTVNPVVTEAAEALRAERGLAITVDTQGGSSGGIAALGEGRVEVAMSSKPLAEGDRAKYPAVAFVPARIGADAVALIVSRDVWEGGVQALSKAQMLGVYEGRVKNWKELGGPDRRIAFFSKEPGRGTWEVFAHWLYGDAKKAPLVSWPEVGANAEARSKVAGTRGAMSQLSASWADGKTVFALGLVGEDGTTVRPSPEAITSGAYGMSRPLLVITNGAPKGGTRQLIDFLLGPRGQALVAKHGYLKLADLPARGAGGGR